MAHRKKISFYDNFMKCKIQKTNNESLDLEYCRFIRPDGKGKNQNKIFKKNFIIYKYIFAGIYPQITSSEYSSNTSFLNDGICRLNFLKPSILNVGKWFCVAKLKSSEMEYYDTVIVDNNYYVYLSKYNYDYNYDIKYIQFFLIDT